MKRLPRQYKRADRRKQILAQFAVWYTNGDNEPKTMNRIAKALGLVPSQHVTDILMELTSEGELISDTREKSGRWTARVWSLHPDKARLITEKFLKRRTIRFNPGKKNAGQLELWT